MLCIPIYLLGQDTSESQAKTNNLESQSFVPLLKSQSKILHNSTHNGKNTIYNMDI